MLAIVHVILDCPNPSDHPTVRLAGDPVLRFGVLEEGVFRRG